MSEQLSTSNSGFDYDSWRAGIRVRKKNEQRRAERQLDTEELHRQLGRTGLHRLMRPFRNGRVIATIFNRQRKGEYNPLAAQQEAQVRANDPLHEESVLERMRRERARRSALPDSHKVIGEDDSGYKLGSGENPFASEEDDALIDARIAAKAAQRAAPAHNPFADE